MPNLGTVNTTTSIATSAELAAAQAAAEATAAADVDAHEADTTSVHGIPNTANLYAAGGTDVAVADGGTGAGTAAGARTNLGLVIGTDVQAFDADIPTVAASQAEMEAGTEAAIRSMSPLQVAQGIAALAGGGGAPADAAYLVTTANAGLSAEVVVTAAGLALLDDAAASDQRTTLGLGTIATQAANNVSITGGAISGITDLALADGGTGASTAAAARTNLGVLAPMAQRTGVLYPGRCSGVTNNQADTLNVLQAYPFDVPVAATYDRMAVTVATSVASTLFRMGIYTDNGGKPDVLILDAGQLNCAAGGDLALTISQALSAGTVWLAGVAQGVAPSLTHATGYGGNGLGTAGGFSLPIAAAYSQTGITGALPNPWGATLTGLLRMPIIYLRAT